MYICMYVCMYVRACVRACVRTYGRTDGRTHLRMFVRMYVCVMHVCMYNGLIVYWIWRRTEFPRFIWTFSIPRASSYSVNSQATVCMYVCTYVYMYVYMCECPCVRAYVHTCVCACVRICESICCVRACAHMFLTWITSLKCTQWRSFANWVKPEFVWELVFCPSSSFI